MTKIMQNDRLRWKHHFTRFSIYHRSSYWLFILCFLTGLVLKKISWPSLRGKYKWIDCWFDCLKMHKAQWLWNISAKAVGLRVCLSGGRWTGLYSGRELILCWCCIQVFCSPAMISEMLIFLSLIQPVFD